MSDRLTPRLENGRARLLAGIRRHHGYAESVKTIPEQWEDFVKLGELPGQQGKTAYGAMCGTDPEKGTFEYMCGAEVSGFEELPSGMGRMRVPAKRYAVFTHDGPVAKIRHTWDAIVNQWLPSSGYRSADTPDFELYDDRFDADTESGIVEIWIGIEPADAR